MAILTFVTKDLRMSAMGSRSGRPDVDLYMGLLKQIGDETVSLLSPYGGLKEFHRHQTLAKSALPLIFKKFSFRSIADFLELAHGEAVALDLLTLVRFTEKRVPLLGVFIDAISHFLRYAAANMIKQGNRYMRVTVVLTAPGATSWHALDEPPAPLHRASAASLLQVAKLHPVEGPASCAICCEEYDGGCVRTPCDHEFHRGCLALWLDTNPSCPLCRNGLDVVAPAQPALD